MPEFRRILATVVFALGALFVSTSAQAITVNFGTLTVPGGASTTTAPGVGSFTDDYLFRVQTTANLIEGNFIIGPGITTSSTPSTSDAFVIELWKSTTSDMAIPMGSSPLAFDDTSTATGTGQSYGFTFANLVGIPMQYFVRAIGTSADTFSNYSVQLVVATKPMPQSIVLLGSALVGLIGFARIRRSGRA